MIKSHYVDNKKLTVELSAWADVQRYRAKQDLPKERIPEYIGSCVLDICNNIVKKPNFVNYSFREGMVGDAIENCIRYISNFDGTRSNNAFAYISQIAFSAIIRRIKKEKMISNRHINYIKDIVDVDELSEVLSTAGDMERMHYAGYLDNLKGLIDTYNEDVPEVVCAEEETPHETETDLYPESITQGKSILEIMMEQGQSL